MVWSIFPELTASKTVLLDWLCPQVTDEMLHDIAGADYGYNQEANFISLQKIRLTKEVSNLLEFNLREPLELCHYSDIDDTDKNGHIQQAFVCTVLLIAELQTDDGSPILDESHFLVKLVNSTRVLGGLPQTLRFLRWCWEEYKVQFALRCASSEWDLGYTEEEIKNPNDKAIGFPVLALSMFLVEVMLSEGSEKEAGLPQRCEWLLKDKVAKEDKNAHQFPLKTWSTYESWKALTERILLDKSKPLSDTTRTVLADVFVHLFEE